MTALATVDDLEAVVGPVADPTRATRLLEMASAVAERWCRRTFAVVTTATVVIRSYDGELWLPNPPVLDVISVTPSGASPLSIDDYTWSTDGQITLTSGLWASTPYTAVYDRGYDPVPDNVVAVVCAMAGRVLAAPLGAANLGTGPFTTGLRDDIGTGIGLTDKDKNLLRPFRRVTTSVPIAR